MDAVLEKPTSELIRTRINGYYMTKRRVTRPWLVCAVDFIVLSKQHADVARSLGADHIRIRCCFRKWKILIRFCLHSVQLCVLNLSCKTGFRCDTPYH